MSDSVPNPGREIRAIIFDWDQTLWDSWTLHQGAIQQAASGMGLPVPSLQRILDTFCGTLEEHMVRLYGSSQGPLKHYMEFYHAHRQRLGRLFLGVSDVLAALQREGYITAVLSDKVQQAGQEELHMVNLSSFFHAAVFRDGTNIAKPDPRALWQVLERLQVGPQEALYVGDAPWDMECARRAGVASVGALWGSVDTPALLAARPDHLWQRPEDALALFKE